ncbi:MAG: OmpA family protein, partial [Bacteroidota bacterium]
FTSASLTRDQIGVYSHLLNIIGQRLALDPSASITVAGYGSNAGPEQGHRELSRARAEAVKAYLTSTWKVDPARIKTRGGLLPDQPANSSTPEGRSYSRTVQIELVTPIR